MARPLRIEFPGAIYHVMARGNARQRIVVDDADWQRLRDGLAQTVERCGWELLTFAVMPNHLHLLLRTPQPNLSRGMQYLLSGYANWFAKQHRQPGHLFQGRFRGELIEDESYFWTVSRYVHLNPVRGRRPLVRHPREWPWSSYAGYSNRRQRVDFVSYDVLLSAWRGEMGGGNPAVAYRRFVEAGIAEVPENPLGEAVSGWLLGSQEFVERMRTAMRRPANDDEVPAARRLGRLELDTILTAVSEHYGVPHDVFRRRRGGHISRDVAAWLSRQLTTLTLRELAEPFGLTHPDSVSNLTRRVDRALAKSSTLRNDVEAIRQTLSRTVNRL